WCRSYVTLAGLSLRALTGTVTVLDRIGVRFSKPRNRSRFDGDRRAEGRRAAGGLLRCIGRPDRIAPGPPHRRGADSYTAPATPGRLQSVFGTETGRLGRSTPRLPYPRRTRDDRPASGPAAGLVDVLLQPRPGRRLRRRAARRIRADVDRDGPHAGRFPGPGRHRGSDRRPG